MKRKLLTGANADVVREFNRRAGLQRRVLVALVLVDAVFGFVAGLRNFYPRHMSVEPFAPIFFTIFFIVVNIVVGWIVFKLAPPAQSLRDCEIMLAMRLRRAQSFAWVVPITLMWSFPVWLSTKRIQQGGVGIAYILIDLSILVLAGNYAALLMGFKSPGLAPRDRDEADLWARACDNDLSRRHRAESLNLGFCAALLGVLVVYVIGLTHTAWAISGLPLVCLWSMALAAARFAWLEQH